MTTTQLHSWSDGNQGFGVFACEHCGGVNQHECWCLTQNANVMTAWEAVLNPAKLSLHDELILHALGAAWTLRCQATARTLSAMP